MGNWAIPDRSGYLDILQMNLLDRRIIPIHGPIDGMASLLLTYKLEYLMAQNDEPIKLQINSLGGDVYQGLAMYDRIMQAQDHGQVINTEAIGTCMSMAVILLQTGRKRSAHRNTSLLLHEISSYASGKVSEIKEEQKELERLDGVLNAILSERSGMPIEKLRKLFERRDLFIDVKTAKKYNLIDKII